MTPLMEAATLTPLPSTAKRLCLDLCSSALAAGTSQHASSQDGASPSLSTDVILEILTWTPARSLCRFLCVSSPWRALISDPAFVAAHESRAEPLLVGSFHLGASLRLMDADGTVVRSLPGVDGCWMLCTSHDHMAYFTDEHSPDPQVINLATGEMLLTRPDPHEGGGHGFGYYQLLNAQRYSFGFGRAASYRAYKVLRLTERRHYNGDQACEVLTLGDVTGWRQTHPPTTPVSLCYYHSSVAINGVLHFMVLGKNNVLCFDIEGEAWNRTIQGPWEANLHDLPEETIRNVNIAELDGVLCMAQTKVHAPDGNSYTDIWLLDGSDSSISWAKIYTVHMDGAVDLVKPLRMMRDGGKLLFYYSEDNSPPTMQIYDPHDETCTNLVGTTTAGLTGTIALCNYRLPRFLPHFRPHV